jgi:hypothetical protein
MGVVRKWVCVLMMTAAVSAAAQQITGNIRGTVTDASGAIVQSAAVTARQVETGLTRTTFADHTGVFVLVELPVGRYRLTVGAKGFQEYIQDGITLDVNETANVPVRLAVGAETEHIQVMADAQLIQTTSTSLGSVVDQTELVDLPLDGRNFSQLGLLLPGVTQLTPGLKQAGGSLRDGQAYVVNGQRPESNGFLIDGANNVNSVDAGFVLRPPIDAIAELLLTHTPTQNSGRTGGPPPISFTLGTNLHGARCGVYPRRHGPELLDAWRATLKQNQFSATFGGPIVNPAFSLHTTRGSAIGRERRWPLPCLHGCKERGTFRNCARWVLMRMVSATTWTQILPISCSDFHSRHHPRIRCRSLTTSSTALLIR